MQQGKTAEGFYSDLKRFDTEDDWTYSLSEDELRAVAEDMVEFNSEMLGKLSDHGFDIYDTSNDREAVFEEIVRKIVRG